MLFYSRVVSCWLLVFASLVFAGCGDDGGVVEADGGVDGSPSEDTVAPVAGSGPAFSGLTATSVKVTWGAATDDVTPVASLQYKVVRAGTAADIDSLAEVAAITSGAALVLDFTANTRSIDVAGLVGSTTYAFAVVVQDLAGNEALYAPATVTTVDGTAPTVTITSPASNGTFATAELAVALTGTASDDTSVASVSWANTTNGTSGAATGTTSWSVAEVPLAVGANAITVTAIDEVGNAATDTITVTRDHAGPALTITAPSSASTFATAASTVALGGTASDPAGVMAVTWSNSSNSTSGTATGTTSWSVAAVTLVAGANPITVTATDALGNSTTATITVTRDNTAPSITITTPDATSTTAAATVDLAGTASDATDISSIAWTNTTNATSGTATGTTTWTIAAVALAVGVNTIVVTATDAVGNAASATVSVTRDNAGPDVTITSPATATHITAASTIALSGTAADPAEIATVTWANASTMTSGTATGTTSWSIATVTLAAGANVITVTATDAVGNTGTATITVTRDNTGPAIAITSPTSAATFLTAASTLGLAGTASDASGVAAVAWTNSSNATSGAASGTTSWTVASVALVEGANVITVTATDGVGNMGSATITVTKTPQLAVEIVVSSHNSCALLDDGNVKCWGYGAGGRNGSEDSSSRGDQPNEMGGALPIVNLGTGRTAVSLTAGAFHICAVLDDGTVKCWGNSTEGSLGLGLANSSQVGDSPGEMGDGLPTVPLGTGRTAVALSSKYNHTCALLDNASIKCWGSNGHGQLGLGDTASRGDQPGEMGDALPEVFLGTGRTAISVAVGSAHTCALLDDGMVKCWGYNAFGQLGHGDTESRGDDPAEMSSLPITPLGAGRTAVALQVGGDHTCALLDDGSLKCWGRNHNGQLGLGDTSHRGDQTNEMGDSLFAVALGTGRRAVALGGGLFNTCAVLDDGTVKCWGNNQYGNLGLGDTASRGLQADEMGDSLPAVSLGGGLTGFTIAAHALHTCALLANGRIKCWGYNNQGQLGLGDTATRGDQANEMGDNLPFVDL